MSEASEAPAVANAEIRTASTVSMGFMSEQVGFQLHIARRALLLKLRDLAPSDGHPLPTGSISVLILVELNPGLSQQAVADTLALDSSKVTMLIQQLARAGLIVRKRASDDRRRLQLFITAEGSALVSQARTVSDGIEDMIEQALGPRDKKQLLALLGRLQDALK